MTKILNVDGLKKESFVITLGGIQYPKKEMSVGDFIKITELAEAAEAKKETTSTDRIKFLIDSVAISFPTCPKEVLVECTFEELNVIATFARDGSLPDDAEIVEEVESGDPKKEAKVG